MRSSPPAELLLLLLHTYLVGAAEIMNSVGLSGYPALHSAEVARYESPSGASLAQFLMAFLMENFSLRCARLVAGPRGREQRADLRQWHRHLPVMVLSFSFLEMRVNSLR